MPKDNPKVGEIYGFSDYRGSDILNGNKYKVIPSEESTYTNIKSDLVLENIENNKVYSSRSLFGNHKHKFELLEGVKSEKNKKKSYKVEIKIEITVNEV